jgi:ribonuclease R
LIRAFLIDTEGFDQNYAYYESAIDVIAERCSIMERKSDELERETDKLKTTQFMANKVNQVFEAVISNVTKAGLFIRLDNGIEGLCPIRLMKDYYYFDDKNLSLQGKASRQTFKLGQTVKVKLKDVDLKLRQLTFVLNEEKSYERKDSRPKQKGKA